MKIYNDYYTITVLINVIFINVLLILPLSISTLPQLCLVVKPCFCYLNQEHVDFTYLCKALHVWRNHILLVILLRMMYDNSFSYSCCPCWCCLMYDGKYDVFVPSSPCRREYALAKWAVWNIMVVIVHFEPPSLYTRHNIYYIISHLQSMIGWEAMGLCPWMHIFCHFLHM